MSKTITIDFNADTDVQIAQARAQGVTLANAYYGLPVDKRAQAFTVSGLARLDQVQRVADALAKAQAEGQTLGDFQKWAKTQDWQLPKWHLETVYRNAVQTAYMAGHWRSFDENASALPYLMYDSINDSRTRPSHLALDGVIKPVGDAFWKTHACPNGHRCRCSIRQLTRADAMRRGGVTQNVPAEGKADDGWGHKPTDGFKGLLKSIESRLSKCSVDFGVTLAKHRHNQPMWCEDGPARDLLLMQKLWAARGWQMPAPRDLVLPELAVIQNGQEAQAFMRFMDVFGGGSTARVPLPSGDVVHVQRKLFQVRDGDDWKISDRGRDRWLLYLAPLIKTPQEIWRLKLAMSEELYLLGRFQRGKQVIETIAVFKRTGDEVEWIEAKTIYAADDKDAEYLKDKRAWLMKKNACIKYLEV